MTPNSTYVSFFILLFLMKYHSQFFQKNIYSSTQNQKKIIYTLVKIIKYIDWRIKIIFLIFWPILKISKTSHRPVSRWVIDFIGSVRAHVQSMSSNLFITFPLSFQLWIRDDEPSLIHKTRWLIPKSRTHSRTLICSSTTKPSI